MAFTRPRSILLFLLLQKVLQTNKETLIKKTVAQLPLPAVLPLLKEVSPVFVYDVHKLPFLYRSEVGSVIFVLCFFSSQKGFKDTLLRKWSFFLIVSEAQSFHGFYFKSLQINPQADQ